MPGSPFEPVIHGGNVDTNYEEKKPILIKKKLLTKKRNYHQSWDEIYF